MCKVDYLGRPNHAHRGLQYGRDLEGLNGSLSGGPYGVRNPGKCTYVVDFTKNSY